MDFTLRFMLGIILVLTTCSVLDCASTWRHIRQVSPIDVSQEAPLLHNDVSTANVPTKEDDISNNASKKVEVAGQLWTTANDSNKSEKNALKPERKPKTESSTEKQTKDSKVTVNKTNNDSNTKVDKKNVNKNETTLEKPLIKNFELLTKDAKQNHVKKESQNPVAQEKEAIENVPETKNETLTSRIANSRSLDMDISKYVSSEFHNKNNVYSLSVSPDTEKYTNLHNELPRSTTSRLPLQTQSETIFGIKATTPLEEDFDKKYQTIEDGVKQKLEYIDHHFAEADDDFKKSQAVEFVNISKLLDDVKNDTAVNLNYSKFKSYVNNSSRDQNNIRKETDLESSQNVDYRTSYNKTQILVEPPKDYKNKIIHEEEIISEILPDHSDTKPAKSVTKPVAGKHSELEIGNEKIPEINFKESTSLTKPPSLNKTENHKSLISNKIETEVINPIENNMKMKWDFPFVSAETTTIRSRVRLSTPSISVTKSGQQEEAVDISQGKGNAINVSKRGSTKFVDTVKATTAESVINYKVRNFSSTNKLEQITTNREHNATEQSVLENQVYPIQIPAPGKDQKDEQVVNDTTEKSVTTEDDTLSLKLYTTPAVATVATNTTLTTIDLVNQTDDTTVMENITTTQYPEWTTKIVNNTAESATLVNVTYFEKTTEYQSIIMSTAKEIETATILENLTASANTEATISSTTVSPTTFKIETTVTNYLVKNDEFTTTTYSIDFTTDLGDVSSDVSEDSAGLETTASAEGISVISYSTDPEDLEYLGTNLTTTSYEDDNSASSNTTDYSEYDERSSSGRELKGNSDEASFSSIDESSNTLEVTSPPTTVAANFNQVTTEEQMRQMNKTTEGSTKSTSSINLGTSDYRENSIVTHEESTTTTKSPEEASQEFGGKTNISNNDVDDIGELEPGNDDDLDVGSHSTLSPRQVKPNTDYGNTETTSMTTLLNTSVVETDGTDSTTIGDNLGLGSEDNVNGGPIAAIIISCIGAACLVLLAGLLIVMRKRHKRFNYGQRCTPVSLDAYSVDNVSVYNSMRRKGAMRASKRSYGNPAFEDPTSLSRPLNFAALAKFTSNTETIAKEFEEIPQVTAQTNELPEGCETKNRYANVIPLPETRVFLRALDGYPNSDYINANYVTGFKSIRGYYIACQAPMQSTVDDFWRMVWEQQSKVILMLTHLFENGTEKCVDYLPPSEVLDCHRLFGDFQVTLKKREVKEKYVISSLQLKNMVSNSWREVTHLWYLGWPEKGVPSEANSLIAFLIEARSYFKTTQPLENGKPKESAHDTLTNSEQSPVVIHCSPGTGRTGTVIACDIAIREFELTRQVDIPKTVYRIRRDRASSVQTKEQYEFIYKVICLYATKLTGGVLDSF